MESELIKLVLGGIALLGSMGLIFGIGLALAARKFAVETDHKVEEVKESLPMAQCGACGFPGCEGYAIAVVKDQSVSPSLCFPGKKEVAEIIADLTGKELDFKEGMVANVKCSCIGGNVKRKSNYTGFTSCLAAELAFGGPSACRFGCTGLGDCEASCPFDAIIMVDDFPLISPELCVGCGICVEVCPKNIMELAPIDARVLIQCSTKEIANKSKKVCGMSCTYCKKCVKECPAGAITIEADLMQIDHEKCVAYGPDCNEICIECCPRDIVLVNPYNKNITKRVEFKIAV